MRFLGIWITVFSYSQVEGTIPVTPYLGGAVGNYTTKNTSKWVTGGEAER